jgi:outer membrane autotransporter protein
MDASTMVLYVGAGKEMPYGSWTFTPVAAFQAANYSQDSYDEVSTNAIGRAVDSYDRWSCKSILGAHVDAVKNLQRFDLVMRLNASWQHEFNADVDTLTYTLIDGTTPHYFTIQAPVEDAFDLGASIGALFGENLEVSLGLDGRYAAEFTAISYNGKIQYNF